MKNNGKNEKGQFVKGRKFMEEESKKHAESMIGNQNAVKLKDEEVLFTAYSAYCQWIATGRGKQGFVFDYEKEDGTKCFVTWQAIERCAQKNPTVCHPDHKERAENLAYQVWENTGIEMMTGKLEKCQPAVYQMMMRNKFSWDKESKVSHTYETDARKFMKYCENANIHVNDVIVDEGTSNSSCEMD